MKYRLAGIVAMALMLVTALGALALEPGNTTSRVHQHLTARQPDAGCDCDGSELCTHLPLIIIDTGGQEIPGEPLSEDGLTQEEGGDVPYEYENVTLAPDGSSTILCQVQVMEGDDQNHHPSDDPDLELTARIRIRGNTSRLFDKKGYLLDITDEDGVKSNNVSMLGMSAHHQWALHGPFLDKSLLRNYLWYNIAAEFMDYAPNIRFCEVIINGEYQSLYVMVETITNGEDGRLNMTVPENGTTAVSYVVRLDRGSSNPIKNVDTFSMVALRNTNIINIVYPGTNNLTPERVDYIRQDFSDFEKTLYSYDYDTEPYAWWDLADMDSFADFFLVTEFTCNYDVGSRSTYVYKDVRGKYKMCIWDMNSSCDNFHFSQTDPQDFRLQYITWFNMLVTACPPRSSPVCRCWSTTAPFWPPASCLTASTAVSSSPAPSACSRRAWSSTPADMTPPPWARIWSWWLSSMCSAGSTTCPTASATPPTPSAGPRPPTTWGTYASSAAAGTSACLTP